MRQHRVGFDFPLFVDEIQAIRKGHFKRFLILPIDVGALTGWQKLEIAGNWNGIALLSAAELNGAIVASSAVARVAFKYDEKETPFGIIVSRVANSGDIQAISATIADLWYRVVTADAGQKFYLLLTCAISISGQLATGGYGPPAASSTPGGGGSGGSSSSGGGDSGDSGWSPPPRFNGDIPL